MTLGTSATGTGWAGSNVCSGGHSLLSRRVRAVAHGEGRAILAVVRAAFTSEGHDAREEVRIVISTWNCHAVPPSLGLVAVDWDDVVGHVIAAVGLLRGPRDKTAVSLGIAPLSVRPDHQGRAVGTMLMEEVLDLARAKGWPHAFLLGDPEYYARFGFEPASRYDISYMGTAPDDPHFMVCRLGHEDVPDPGEFSYCWELYPDGRDVHRVGELPGYCSKPVRMMCDYGAGVPLFPQSRFTESLVPVELLEKLKAWQADFEEHFSPRHGWLSAQAKERWTTTAHALEPELRAALTGKAEIVVDLWPLSPD